MIQKNSYSCTEILKIKAKIFCYLQNKTFSFLLIFISIVRKIKYDNYTKKDEKVITDYYK